jgi:transposase
MSTLSLFPHLQGLQILAVTAGNDMLSLALASQHAEARCPLCRQSSIRVHSCYSRRVAHLPIGGLRVCLRLRVRRFFCDTDECSCRIFAERFADVVAPFARHSGSLRSVLEQIGFALGGRPGARLAQALAMPASPSTLLRRVREAPEPATATPRVLGVDDWALRKGHTYGTILVDLERGCPMDLLPDRQAQTLANWLREHPGVEVISRDRAGAYAEGARLGAPDAVQVADRWHLLKNLGDALERLLQRHQRGVQAAATGATPSDKVLASAVEPVLPHERAEPTEPVVTPAMATADESASLGFADLETDAASLSSPPPDTDGEPGCRQTHKQLLHEHAHQLFRQGCTPSEIARRLQLNRRTVRRYLGMEMMPERQTRTKRGSLLDPHTAFLQKRLEEGCHNASQLHRELRARGYSGGRTLVKQWVTQRRRKECVSLPPPRAAMARVSIRQMVWYFVRPPEVLKEAERSCLERLCQTTEVLRIAYRLGQRFGEMVRQRQVEKLPEWLNDAKESEVAELCSFAAGLERDGAAVKAGLELEWSNGPVERQVQRLKTIKRQMYGRAKLDLLPPRVLHAA